MADYEYDVAFSFHQADEGMAIALNDLLQDRFKTFIYMQHQKVLAGTDGEISFADTFAKKARVVVIFLRPDWGQTPFTRIEETAIRGRAHEEGYDFTLFIPTVDGARMPAWLPRTQLYLGLQRFGLVGAAAAIEQKIQTLGGAPVVETVGDRAARFERARKLKAAQEQFLNSDEGVNAASAAYELFREALEAEVEVIRQTMPAVKSIVVDAMTVVTGLRFVLSCGWSTRYTNVLRDCPLLANYQDNVPHLRGYQMPFEKARVFATDKFQYSLVADGHYAYVLAGPENRTFSPAEVASYVLGRYMDMAEKHVPKN